VTRKKPPHCEQCGRFLKRIPVLEARLMGRLCVEHGLSYLESEPTPKQLMDAFLQVHRERMFLLRKYMGKGRIK